MTENIEARTPDGEGEAVRVSAGEPSRVQPGAPQADQRPDLDAREERIGTSRKPLGPSQEEAPDRDDTPPQVDEGDGPAPTDPSHPQSAS
jgi:hypothetical protein